MALPLLAPTMIRRMSPRDTIDVYPVLNIGEDVKHILQSDEFVTEFSVELTAEASAAGMQIATGANRPRYANRVFAIQVTIDPAKRGSAIFDGAGVTVGVIITFSTNLFSRQKQYTFGIRVVRK